MPFTSVAAMGLTMYIVKTYLCDYVPMILAICDEPALYEHFFKSKI